MTGQIGLVKLLLCADVLGCMDGFSSLFPMREAKAIEEFVVPPKRGGGDPFVKATHRRDLRAQMAVSGPERREARPWA